MKRAAFVAVFLPNIERKFVLDEMFGKIREKGCDAYVGIQYGSIPETEAIVMELCKGLNTWVARVPKSIYVDSDASSYIAALDAYRSVGSPEYGICYFIHSKGVCSSAHECRRDLLNNLFNGTAENHLEIPGVGSYAPYMSIFQFEVHGYHRKDVECMRKFSSAPMLFPAMPYFYTFTFFAIKGNLFKVFMDGVDPALFRTPVHEYSDRWLFERDFFHITDMMGYIPSCNAFHRYYCQRHVPIRANFNAMVAAWLRENPTAAAAQANRLADFDDQDCIKLRIPWRQRLTSFIRQKIRF